ncbi:hypothetical protein amyaer_p04635 (plasmid) [Microcystis aeruginosa NIES-2481]|nr:hypothetical protein amyaer_p04635 [Microcystis aeruginosa NIES-2481]
MQTGRTLCDEVGVGNGRPPNQYPLEYCGVGEAIAVLREQYVVGTVTAKIVQPKPDELKILP